MPPSSSAVERTSSASRAVTHTSAPAAASCPATARPIPRVAPVTTAALPSNPYPATACPMRAYDDVIPVPSHDGPSGDTPETGVACRDHLPHRAPVLRHPPADAGASAPAVSRP